MNKKIIKKILFSVGFIFVFVFLYIVVFLISEYWLDDKDSCLDTGICKQGLEVNTEYGLIKINKETCTQYNWQWIEEYKICNIQK